MRVSVATLLAWLPNAMLAFLTAVLVSAPAVAYLVSAPAVAYNVQAAPKDVPLRTIRAWAVSVVHVDMPVVDIMADRGPALCDPAPNWWCRDGR